MADSENTEDVRAPSNNSEQSLRRFCEAITAGAVVQDTRGNIVYANKAACEILALTMDQILGRTSHDPGWQAIREDGSPFPGQDHPSMVTLRTGKPLRDVVMGVYSQKADLFRWISIDSEPILDPDTGAMVEVLTTFVDITERKRSQEALRFSEQRFRNLVETTSDWVWEVDQNLVYTYASPRIRDILGYEPEEVVGKTPFDLMPADEARRISAFTDKLLASPRYFDGLENINRHKDGRLVVLQTNGMPFFDAEGKLLGFRGIDRDITEHQRADEALRRSEAFLRLITDAVPARIAYVDREHRFRFVNRQYELWFNRPREEMIGKHISDVLGEELYRRILPYVEEALAGKEVTYELTLEAGDGEKRYVRIAYSPHFEGNQEVIGFFGLIEDITEHKSLEEQLRQSQKMEAIGTLAGGVAHDFNNLLTVITGSSDLVLEQLGPHDPLSKDIQEIKKAGERAASLTRQLLAFSRKQILRPEVLDLNSVIIDLEKMLRRLIGENVDFRTVLDPSLRPVRADPGQVEQIIINLAVNAHDAMPDGGELLIETKNVSLDASYARLRVGAQPGEYVVLAVSDTGVGMDAETRSHLFEPFFTTKEVGRGTGLGLSTVYGIVKQSGGHIWVYSEPGQGSTFKIYLPVAQAASEPARSLASSGVSAAGNETILVVEDDPSLRKLEKETLARRGYKVLESSDGEQALRIAGQFQQRIDLLLTDVVMPVMSGRELAQKLAALRPEVKVLYVSGYADSVIVHHGILDPGISFLQKPFTPDALVRRVREVLDGAS